MFSLSGRARSPFSILVVAAFVTCLAVILADLPVKLVEAALSDGGEARLLPALPSEEPPAPKPLIPEGEFDHDPPLVGESAAPGVSNESQGPAMLTNSDPPPPPVAVSPDIDATVFTLVPELQVAPITDPEGGVIQYWFRITTGFEGAPPGQVVESGWLSSPSWTVPASTLKDGVTYAWTASSFDGTFITAASWAREFTVDLQLGGESATDTFGPVTVGLTNGNASASASSPAFTTIGGSVGVSYSYNSLKPFTRGLIGEYSRDVNGNRLFDDSGAQMTRTDSLVNFDWGSGSAHPPIGSNNFLVRWTGHVQVPAEGAWLFGASSDDGVRIWINDTLVLDRWFNQTAGAPVYGSQVLLEMNERVPIKIEYYDATSVASISLRVRGPAVPPDTIVPSSWLDPGTESLSAGWDLGTGAGELSYLSARVNDNSVTLIGPFGDTHEYKLNGTGYTPPPGEDGVLATDASTGNLVLHDVDGSVYTFRKDGTLARAVQSSDGTNTAAPEFVWSGTPARVTTIRDAASGREVILEYGGGDCPAEPGGAGFDDDQPGGMLCRVRYWDGTQTHLFYVAAQLARIVDPGGETTDFGYTGGRLTAVRDSLAADAVADGQRANDATVTTSVTYDGFGRVSQISLPAATSGAARLARTYTYGSGQSTVDLPGVANHRVVHIDSRGRVTQDVAPDGLAQSFEWDAEDRLISTTDPAGRKSTTLYDAQGRPTDEYGPAPAAWFGADRRPLAGFLTQVPHSQTGYDEGINSLGATYWTNSELIGSPKCYETGVGHLTGSLSAAWLVGAPGCLGSTSDNWSGRYTGEVLLPQTGTYTFKILADGGARLWIDDTPVIDSWADGTGFKPDGPYTNSQANSRHRIRLEYRELTGTALLELHWVPPGGISQLVPGANLSPRYGLVTSETTDDAQAGTIRSTTSYAAPHHGTPTATTQDPTGQALSAQMGYESAGHNRPVSRTLPAGNQWTYAYWGDNESNTVALCPSSTNSQAGMLKTRTGPDPDGSGGQTSLVEEYIYDAQARRTGVRVAGGGWSCTRYDARGRVIEQEHPAFGAQPARDVTIEHDDDGNPLLTTVSDPAGTITTNLDLLGRVVSYTDAWAKTTTYTYDGTGRLAQTSGPAGVQASTFDSATGRETSQKLDGQTIALPTYNGAGEVSSVNYPSGAGNAGNGTSLSSITRDGSGRTTGLNWLQAGGALLTSDQVTRSQSGRVIDQAIDGSDPRTSGANFVYDSVGRLTNAWVPGRTTTYAYAGSGGCGSLASAGKNTNRTSMTINGGPAINYCYDAADRLTSTTDSRYGSIGYDARRNTTTLGPELMTYDGADRHVKTNKGVQTVTYKRDATDRIIERTISTGSSVAFRAKAQANSGTLLVSELSIPRPAGVAVGDLLVLHLSVAGTTATPVAPPFPAEQWALAKEATNGSALRSVVYWKRATAADVAQGSYLWTFSAPAQVAAGIGAWSGVHPDLPITVGNPQVATAATSVTAPGIWGYAGGVQLAFFALVGGPVNHTGAGVQERWESFTPAATESLRSTSAVGEKALTATGTTAARTANSNQNLSTWIGHQIALRPGETGTVTRYGYSGDGDSPDFTLNGENVVIERTIPLAGGALLTKRTGGDVWSYPNIHGDVVATAISAGAKQGPTRNYDPFGEAPGGVPDNSEGNFDYGWLGSHQRPAESEDGIATIEMGARPYVPGLGRFLSTDPIEGGCANDYVYVRGDPTNSLDLDGNEEFPRCAKTRIQNRYATLIVKRQGGGTWHNGYQYVKYFIEYHLRSDYRQYAARGGRMDAYGRLPGPRNTRRTHLETDYNKDNKKGWAPAYWYMHFTVYVRPGSIITIRAQMPWRRTGNRGLPVESGANYKCRA